MDDRPFFSTQFLLGIEHIDREHQKLFEILGRVHDALQANDFSAGPIILDAVVELIEYARTHFASEESAMAKAGYPALAEHKELHRHLLEMVRDMELRSECDSQYLPIDLAAFLYHWLVDHILIKDKAFGDFYHSAECDAGS